MAGSGSGWEQAEPIAPIVDKLTAAMGKIYRPKNLDFQQQIADGVVFHGDKTDLLELLGNLMDNACKAARKTILVTVQLIDNKLDIGIEDDGPGIAPGDRKALLTRGKRLDSYQEGQGIGLAVVADLVAAYQGQLEMMDSELGGAKIRLRFPLQFTR